MTSSHPFSNAAAAGRPERPCVALFGNDGSLSERVTALQASGLRVADFILRPDHGPVGQPLRRLLSVALAVPALIRARRHLAQADVLWARDLDMAVLALLARRIARTKAPIAYEVLEVPPVFVGRGPAAFLLRLAERIALARSDLLVVGSPALMGHYFAPVQGFAAPWALLDDDGHADGGMAGLCRRLLSRTTPTAPAEPRCARPARTHLQTLVPSGHRARGSAGGTRCRSTAADGL